MLMLVILSIISNATLHLRDSARASNRRTTTGSVLPQFDPIATSQIVALVEDSDSVFKLSALRQMYRALMEEHGSPCHDTRGSTFNTL